MGGKGVGVNMRGMKYGLNGGSRTLKPNVRIGDRPVFGLEVETRDGPLDYSAAGCQPESGVRSPDPILQKIQR